MDSNEVAENIIHQNSKFSFTAGDKSFFFGRSSELPIANAFGRGFVVESFVNVIEQIIVGITMSETILLVGETGTGKTTIVQNIANVIGKKLHVFNMSQNTDSTDLMGGFKPIDTKLLLKPLYLEFLDLFNSLFDQSQNKEFIQIIVSTFNKSKNTEFFKCIEHGVKSIEKKLVKFQAKKKTRPTLVQEFADLEVLKQNLIDTKQKIKKADKSFIFKFIEGKLVQSIKNGDWILLDEINLAPEEVLNKVISIIDKTVLITEKADVENIVIHPEFRMFCCMNPHHSSAGKKQLIPSLRSKMSEIFVDELDKQKDIIPIVQINLSSLFDAEFVNRITRFYLEIKSQIKGLQIHYGTKKPAIGLRNLVRALKYVESALTNQEVTFAPMRALYEALILNFTTQVDEESQQIIIKLIKTIVFDKKPPNKDNMESLKFSSTTNKSRYVIFENYAIKKGKFDPVKKLGIEADWEEKFIMTSTFKTLVKTFASIICCTNYAILIEGPTSAGKTSTIEYLAKKTHNKCIRINNHEHTDIEEYIGSYIPDAKGKLVFQEGLLVEAVRNGYWVILDELNLAPSEVLEALNRLLDDNNELFIVETQDVVKAHPEFRLFATQNPTEGYGGRKELSEAFKNRFIILHAEEIPHKELSTIVHKRCAIAESHAKKLVAIMKDLQYYRQEASVFRGNDSVITVRDLLKWASRYTVTLEDIAHEGYILLAERMRENIDKEFVKKIIEKHCKVIIDVDTYYDKYFDEHLTGLFDFDDESFISELGARNIIITKTMKKLSVLVHKCLMNKEPVLLVGETGCGKTTICQILAMYMHQKLFSINVHQNTETSDFIGCMRTKRDKISNIESLNQKMIELISLTETDSEDIKEMDERLNDPEKAHQISIKDYSKIFKALKLLHKNVSRDLHVFFNELSLFRFKSV